MWDPTKFLRRAGEWQTPILFGVVDDRSRLACRIVRTLRVPEKRAWRVAKKNGLGCLN
jgi:hypothetical protein